MLDLFLTAVEKRKKILKEEYRCDTLFNILSFASGYFILTKSISFCEVYNLCEDISIKWHCE